MVAQIDETTQKKFLTEFIKQAYAYEYDVCIFSMYQKYQETKLRNIGDSSIFGLVNYDLFDAVLILSDTLLSPGLALPLQEKVNKEFDGPVLVVDQKSPFFESIMMDHYTPIKKIVDHLIDVHQYKDIALLGGKEGHPHSVQRLNAFLDSMKEHGLAVKEDWIFHGNYWYDSAEEFVDKLIKKPNEMPRAIVCANDCMAIGAATRLTERGIRVPEDVAITGYDSIADGRQSPVPVTSADIPAGECGRYCMNWLHARINEVEPAPFTTEANIVDGGNSGCKYEMEMVPKELRSTWRTQQSARGLFSDFNHILEDLLAQNNFKEFMKVVSDYTYQIRPFYSFDICMNEGFLQPDLFVGENAYRNVLTDKVYRVLSCGSKADEPGVIDFENSFEAKKLIPVLNQERRYPTTFIFNPLYFDDRCFGYTVLNQGPKAVLYDESYRIWMRNVMQGLEAFYRQGFMLALLEKVKADQIRDGITGLYNYDGFINHATKLIEKQDDKRQINILTIDVKAMKPLNEIYGRECGERAIKTVARSMQNAVNEDEILCRMFNDEFLIATLDNINETRAKSIVAAMERNLESYRLIEDTDYRLQIHTANLRGKPCDQAELELLVNQAISVKNHRKNTSEDNSQGDDVMLEIKQSELVMKILNGNLITYYYQPIINVIDGSIYAYEALMRYEGGEKISPHDIIEAAKYLNRLADIEKITMLNVTKDVEERLDMFGNAKVFINSIPGLKLGKADENIFSERMKNSNGRFVIEFTEENELNDKQLNVLKNKLDKLGTKIALDDYGAGYSNINNLLRYMPDYVKIDRMLISDIQINPQKQHMVKSIIEYAHDNNIVALAEGVETREELQECIRLGADLIQGYYTSRPAKNPIGEIDENIKDEVERFYLGKSWGLQMDYGQ